MGDSEQSISKERIIKNDNLINRRKAGRVDGKKGAKRTLHVKTTFRPNLFLSVAFLLGWTLATALVFANVWHNHEKQGAAAKQSIDAWQHCLNNNNHQL